MEKIHLAFVRAAKDFLEISLRFSKFLLGSQKNKFLTLFLV